jgi:ribonuclease T1
MSTKFLRNWIFFLIALFFSVGVWAKGNAPLGLIEFSDLPEEAQYTLALIKKGGPYPFSKDGVVFHNYEGVLPKQKRGYYHEFTVRTPGTRNRGGRRIVSGGEPATSGEYYYTDDHYTTFKRIKEQ